MAELNLSSIKKIIQKNNRAKTSEPDLYSGLVRCGFERKDRCYYYTYDVLDGDSKLYYCDGQEDLMGTMDDFIYFTDYAKRCDYIVDDTVIDIFIELTTYIRNNLIFNIDLTN